MKAEPEQRGGDVGGTEGLPPSSPGRWAGWAERTGVVGCAGGGKSEPSRGKWKGRQTERKETNPLSCPRPRHSESKPIPS